MQLEGIDHVAVGVRDVEQSAKWYIEVLGFERLHDGVWNGVPTFVGKGNTGIALFPARRDAKLTSSGHRDLRMLHLAFRADRQNFFAAQRELEKCGIKFEFQDHEISHSIYFRDPDLRTAPAVLTLSCRAKSRHLSKFLSSQRFRDFARNERLRRRGPAVYATRPQQFLYFFPLPHGHGSLRPTFGIER